METSLQSLLARIREIKIHSQQNLGQANNHLQEKISQIYKRGNGVMTFVDALQAEMSNPAVTASSLNNVQNKNQPDTNHLNIDSNKNNSQIKNMGMSSEMSTENALKMFQKLLDTGESPESMSLIPYQKQLQKVLKQGYYQDLSGKDK